MIDETWCLALVSAGRRDADVTASLWTTTTTMMLLTHSATNSTNVITCKSWQWKSTEWVSWLYHLHCVSKKRYPFYFCENLAKYYPISIIFSSSIPEEICNKSMHVYPPHLFTVLIPYRVKITIHPRKCATKVCMFTHHTCLLCWYHTV